MKQRISTNAFKLIVGFETGGRAYYDKRLSHPTWPEGSSGVTIGFGYDLGYEKRLDRDWGHFFNPEQLTRLARCLGKTGRVAQQAVSGVRDIEVPWDIAAEVFNENTLPQEIRKTLATYPTSAARLPADAFGALVSLIFNRGQDLSGDRRREMKQIKILLADMSVQNMDLCQKIAAQFRSMKRLWHDDKDSDGDLVDRREAEAQLIENAA